MFPLFLTRQLISGLCYSFISKLGHGVSFKAKGSIYQSFVYTLRPFCLEADELKHPSPVDDIFRQCGQTLEQNILIKMKHEDQLGSEH